MFFLRGDIWGAIVFTITPGVQVVTKSKFNSKRRFQYVGFTALSRSRAKKNYEQLMVKISCWLVGMGF